jgi:glycosyltransferase involved in cell wall biosynthesis
MNEKVISPLLDAVPGALRPAESPLVSVVLPCLNEARTIPHVIREVQAAFGRSPYPYEIVVADNGSADGSPQIAQSLGTRVVHVKNKGYGAALLGGFQAAQGAIIVFGDADFTYDFKQGPDLVARLMQQDAAMVIGTRMRGTIESGAMPGLHRYLGTPVLTRLINILFGGALTDCNSGFRAFFKEKLALWQVKSTGMEFATELIVNCLKAGDRIIEIPISLRKDSQTRMPHLSTWQDGMRHLLFILSRAPHGFTYSGTFLLACSMAIALPSIVVGPMRLFQIAVFDFHSLILATLAGFLGTQALSYGLILDSESKSPLPINGFLLRINEVWLLRILTSLILLILGFTVFIGLVWARHGFNNLHYLRASLTLLYLTIVVGNLGLAIFIAQVYRRTAT